jgi:hypothetical protein
LFLFLFFFVSFRLSLFPIFPFFLLFSFFPLFFLLSLGPSFFHSFLFFFLLFPVFFLFHFFLSAFLLFFLRFFFPPFSFSISLFFIQSFDYLYLLCKLVDRERCLTPPLAEDIMWTQLDDDPLGIYTQLGGRSSPATPPPLRALRLTSLTTVQNIRELQQKIR